MKRKLATLGVCLPPVQRGVAKWIAMALLCSHCVVSGQEFILDGYVIAAGGGQSSGGDFELSGTVAQVDAGELLGGDFEVSGGFWALVAALETNVAPSLSVALGTGEVIVSWPEAGSAGFTLEETSNFATRPGGTAWTRVDTLPRSSNGTLSVHLPLSAGNRFYRLHHP